MGPAEDPLRRLGLALAAEQDSAFRALPVPRDPSRLMSELARRDNRRRVLRRCSGLAVVVVLVFFLFVRSQPLSFEVGGVGPGRVGAWISAQAEPVPLAFSDGTELTLAADARARIVAVENTGARVVLEQGTLSAHVVHRGDTRWTVVAGPFEVRVTGTRFEVVWLPAADVFELRLKEGAVTVTGPSLGKGRDLHAGEVLQIDARDPEDPGASGPRGGTGPHAAAPASNPDAGVIAPESAAASSSSVRLPVARAVAPAASPGSAPRASPARASSPRRGVLKSLRTLAAAGKYSKVVQVAQANDFSALCREADADDLMLLADAARLSGAAEPARDALLSLRERFPRDPRAATAAFLLGRVFFEQLNAHAQAAHWFGVYLDEQPRGELADDALSRLAEARALSGDPAGAREAARRYLRLNPNGPQAERAKVLAD
jgi:transmembrane sensor